jgi:hypothetical protein
MRGQRALRYAIFSGGRLESLSAAANRSNRYTEEYSRAWLEREWAAAEAPDGRPSGGLGSLVAAQPPVGGRAPASARFWGLFGGRLRAVGPVAVRWRGEPPAAGWEPGRRAVAVW